MPLPLVVTSQKALQSSRKHKEFFDSMQADMAAHKESMAQRKAMPVPNVKDYMASKGMPNDFASREKIWNQMGFGTYYGTTDQNEKLHQILAKKDELALQKTPENTVEEYMNLMK